MNIQVDINAYSRGELTAEELTERLRSLVSMNPASAETVITQLDQSYRDKVVPLDVFVSLVDTVRTSSQAGAVAGSTATSPPSSATDTGPTRTDGVEDATVVNAEGPMSPGTVIRDRFEIVSVLGMGGMGVVYKATDRVREEARDRNPHVALKVLNADFQRHKQAFIALQRECSRTQRLAHPNIATVYDFDRSNDLVYMTMELLEGTPLDHYIKRQMPKHGMPFEQALPWIVDMGNALSYGHEHGIIHSDFKPGNAFVLESGTVKVLDFGIARATKQPGQSDTTLFDGSDFGALTPAYASPEMHDGMEPDPRDDVFALACVAYELLSGHHPFDKQPANTARARSLQPPVIKGLSKARMAALQQGLAFEREERSASVQAFLEALQQAEDTTGSKRWLVAAALALVALVAVGGYFGLSPGSGDDMSVAPADAQAETEKRLAAEQATQAARKAEAEAQLAAERARLDSEREALAQEKQRLAQVAEEEHRKAEAARLEAKRKEAEARKLAAEQAQAEAEAERKATAARAQRLAAEKKKLAQELAARQRAEKEAARLAAAARARQEQAVAALKDEFLAATAAQDIPLAERLLRQLERQLPADDTYVATVAEAKIAEVYVKVAETSLANGEAAEAARVVENGLEKYPAHPQLLQLQRQIRLDQRLSKFIDALRLGELPDWSRLQTYMTTLQRRAPRRYARHRRAVEQALPTVLEEMQFKDYARATKMLAAARSLFPDSAVLSDFKVRQPISIAVVTFAETDLSIGLTVKEYSRKVGAAVGKQLGRLMQQGQLTVKIMSSPKWGKAIRRESKAGPVSRELCQAQDVDFVVTSVFQPMASDIGGGDFDNSDLDIVVFDCAAGQRVVENYGVRSHYQDAFPYERGIGARIVEFFTAHPFLPVGDGEQ